MSSSVERPVTVAVAGTHSTGKTTFIARLAHELRRDKITVAHVADLGETAMSLGLPLLDNHTWASTLWFITKGISKEIEAWNRADVVLVDRPVADAIGYYRAALVYRGEEPEHDRVIMLESLAKHHSVNYDLLFKTTLDPTIPLGDNKERDSNARFRHLADLHVASVLEDLDLPHELLPVDGHDDALAQAIHFIDGHLSGVAGTS
ncbi:AAA domain-containing protein [Lentzea fradiae]|uniref:AAA domain-containing protein n=1 Tax=Lentzea fradiae TaxID=200378 RepID=A0A1G7Z7C1_9PSEU|nr:AAA family ATPase [Lentzea fradiae]SDH04652.1 AAA domain-containing protein [Lentzea fradiae]